MSTHTIGTREEWLAARRQLLQREKELTRLHDELARQRRSLPWVPVDKEYQFASAEGPTTLRGLFGGRPQLVVYHFMFGPGWAEGCPSCSFWADTFDREIVHLNHREVTMVCVSRAPLERLEAYQRRMGWSFRWVSSLGSDFNYDFGVSFPAEGSGAAEYNFRPVDESYDDSEMPGLSCFALEDGVVYHTYSAYARGLDMINGAYQILDLTPKGRDEGDLPWTMAWLRRRDAYEPTAGA